MKLPVDTHCWLWCLLSPDRLNEEARRALQAAENEVHLSVVSAWEIVIKHGLGKIEIPLPPDEYIPSRVEALGHRNLDIRQSHVLAVGGLPLHHKDPFDRVLVAQAQVEGMTLLTADSALKRYEVAVLWAGASGG